jgi:Kef-type K+ transport system membrane component KefB
MDHVFNQSRKLTGGIFLDVPILHNPLSRFFVQAVFIMVICRGLSIIAYPLKQPSVIFEIIGGILMGPSAFGRDSYYLEVMFNHDSLHNVQLVAEIGLVLYLFMVGLELDPKLLASHARSAGGIAIVGMMVPFALGIAISSTLFHNLQSKDPAYADVSPTSFFVFIGTAMSITAFPVLARILKENGLIYTKAGSMAMGAAALNDAVAWCLLILAVSMANSGDMSVAGKVFASVFAFGAGLFVVFRPIFERTVNYLETFNNVTVDGHLFALALCLCLICAWTTGDQLINLLTV